MLRKMTECSGPSGALALHLRGRGGGGETRPGKLQLEKRGCEGARRASRGGAEQAGVQAGDCGRKAGGALWREDRKSPVVQAWSTDSPPLTPSSASSSNCHSPRRLRLSTRVSRVATLTSSRSLSDWFFPFPHTPHPPWLFCTVQASDVTSSEDFLLLF